MTDFKTVLRMTISLLLLKMIPVRPEFSLAPFDAKI